MTSSKLRSFSIFLTSVAAVVFIVFPCVGQSIEQGWKGILPFKTDRETVNKILGRPIVDDNGYHGYDTKEAFVQVNYSTEPCSPDPTHPQINRGKYKLAMGKVLDYTVVLRKTVKLQELGLDLKKYYRDTSGDVANVASYLEYIVGTRKTSNQNGVSISTSIYDGLEYVGRITFYPREHEKLAAACEKP